MFSLLMELHKGKNLQIVLEKCSSCYLYELTITFFILSFGYIGCSYFLQIDYELSIKLQVQKLDYFFKYVELSIINKMKRLC